MATTVFEKPMGAEVEALKGQIGTLSSLTTTAKNNVVSAVNEVNGKIANIVKTFYVDLGNTGTVAAGGTKLLSASISSFITSGYSVFGVIPAYSGDDQFCFTECDFDSANVSARIRNVSSVADSGNIRLRVLAIKNL